MRIKVFISAIALVLLLLFGAWLWRLPRDARIELGQPKDVFIGQTFEVPLRVDVPVAINAAEFYFSFPKDLLEVKEIKKPGSFFELWIKDSPNFSNSSGLFSLAGGLPKPGFTGRGLVGTIVLVAKKPGSGSITLEESSSRLLLNDGLGTELPAEFDPVVINIKDK